MTLSQKKKKRQDENICLKKAGLNRVKNKKAGQRFQLNKNAGQYFPS